jgi:hypothetical protein
MTFEFTPVQYSSVNDPLVYVVYDANAANPTTYPNYKYIAELEINGTQVFKGKYFPHPTSNRGIIDLGAVVREYCVQSFNASVGGSMVADEMGEGEWRVSCVVKIREEYGTTTSAVLVTDSSRVYFNYYNGRYPGFESLSNYDDDVLSDRPTNINLTFTTGNYFIPYFAELSTSFNVVFTGGTTTLTKTITPTAANTMQLINISPAAINDELAGTITTSTTQYSVAIGSKTYVVKILCEGLYKNYNVHFLNKWGGYETMMFNKVSRKTYDVERKTFKQLPYRVSSAGAVSVLNNYTMYKQTTQFGGRFREKLRLNTDWLSDAEYQWLAQLATSAEVYIEDEGELYPVIMTANNYEFREHIVDGLINLMIEVDFGVTYKTQFQ